MNLLKIKDSNDLDDFDEDDELKASDDEMDDE